MTDSYLTVESKSSCEIKVERSRFIATAIPVSARQRAESEYEMIRRQFYSATHNCFAYQIGMGTGAEFRYSDDGEPNGTAGRPIHDTILSRKITNVLIVVTRYFGGIKLGTGGLARAYRQAAEQALNEADIIEKLIMQPFKITFRHEFTSTVMKALSDFELRTIDTIYGEDVTLLSAIRLSRFDDFAAMLLDHAHGKVTIQTTGDPHA